MKNSAGKIIYIGKATHLNKRVPSYFHTKKQPPKTAVLVKNIADIEYIVTDSEIEALILESNLIKKHKPKFNIRLKDDKRFPYIAVTLGEKYPRIIYTRRIANRQSKYYGPFTDAAAARSMMNMANAVFKLKTCKKDLPLKSNERPCLNYQMKRCSGACTGAISEEEYRELINSAMQFLDGDIDPVLSDLHKKMTSYSERMDFEKAAQMRDIIFDIQKVSEHQKVSISMGQDQDYINVGIFGAEALLIIFEFRKGVLLGRKINIFDNADLAEPREVIRSFILDYYQRAEIPGRIIADYSIEDRQLIENYLTAKASHKVTLSQPATGEDRGILDMIDKNIQMLAADREAARFYQNMDEGMSVLRTVLGMDRLPKEIVCFDISNFQGTDSVASMVTFTNGAPDKSKYRRFKIRGHEGPNDPAMIHEAVARRVQHLANESLPLPDLMVIDGGPTQLTRAIEAVSNFDVKIKIISLAKRLEEIYTSPTELPIRLLETSPGLKLLQAVRDEAHRFAITYHRKLRDSKLTNSVLDEIPGISTAIKTILLKKFGSAERVRDASLGELTGTEGIGLRTAEKIAEYFSEEDDHASEAGGK